MAWLCVTGFPASPLKSSQDLRAGNAQPRKCPPKKWSSWLCQSCKGTGWEKFGRFRCFSWMMHLHVHFAYSTKDRELKKTKIRPMLLQKEANICSGTSAMENNPPLLPHESCLWSHPALLSAFSCKVHIKKCERKFSNWKIKSSAIPPERKTLIWLSRSIILSLLVWEMSSLFSLLPGRAEALRFNNECSHSLPIS